MPVSTDQWRIQWKNFQRFDSNKSSIRLINNEFYRIVDKNGRVQVIGTFDQCFDELTEHH